KGYREILRTFVARQYSSSKRTYSERRRPFDSQPYFEFDVSFLYFLAGPRRLFRRNPTSAGISTRNAKGRIGRNRRAFPQSNSSRKGFCEKFLYGFWPSVKEKNSTIKAFFL